MPLGVQLAVTEIEYRLEMLCTTGAQVGGLGSETCTCCAGDVPIWPEMSVALAVTEYVPGSVYVCVPEVPGVDVPSPQ